MTDNNYSGRRHCVLMIAIYLTSAAIAIVPMVLWCLK